MTQYIATFFSHFGAVRFAQLCKARGWQAQLRPVPRSLSSSCGTCVFFSAAMLENIAELKTPELEQLAECVGDGYAVIYTAE